MKKISKSDLKGLTEMFPVYKDDDMREIRGGESIEEIENYLMGYLGSIGYGFSDNFGNYSWYRSYDDYCNAYTSFVENGYVDHTLSQFYLDNGQGGFFHCYALSDGYLYEIGSGITICQSDGRSIFLPGVGFGTLALGGTGYQWNGKINVGTPRAFSTGDIMHEYGHYLQQQEMGNMNYYTTVAIPSLISAWLDANNHNTKWYEEDATRRGYDYYSRYVR